jgi:nucleoid DNA-binding protein
MNRDDLLKRCVDRRVAHETSVVAVSHLFYVYLLSALKKGQRVEVPNFGTFGTHIVGVKRQRRMPFFEVENELAEKVNERYKNLKTLLVGKYELVPVQGEVEYEGKEPPYDPLAGQLGKEVVLDTYRDVSAEEYQTKELTAPLPSIAPEKTTPPVLMPPPTPIASEATEEESASSSKEKKLMPKLNLRGEGMESESVAPQEAPTEPVMPPEPPPTLRDISASSGPSPLLQILLGLLILGAITFALNHFGIIHLWGKKAPVVQKTEESLPPVVQPPPQTEQSTTEQKEPTPTPDNKQTTPTGTQQETKVPPVTKQEEQKKPPVTQPKVEEKKEPPQPPVRTPSGTGEFTVQVSSWPTRKDADRVITRLSGSGFDAYVSEGLVKGRKWFRVRVGRFESSGAAQAAAAKLKSVNENGVWVTKVN